MTTPRQLTPAEIRRAEARTAIGCIALLLLFGALLVLGWGGLL